MTRREIFVVLACLIAASAVLFGSYVAHGSLFIDDWILTAHQKFLGYWRTADFYLHLDHRPLFSLYLPLVPRLFTGRIHAELAWIALAHTLMCFCLYAFLRSLTLERLAAGAITAIALVFPFADATWLYIDGSGGSIAVSLYLLGSIAALRGLQADGAAAKRLHAIAVLLYVASVLTYEVALGAVALSFVVYSRHANWGKALRRGAIDVVALIPTVLLATSRIVPVLPGADVHRRLTVSQQLSHIGLIFRQDRSLLASSLVPTGAPRYTLIVVALILAASLLTAFRLGDRAEVSHELRVWLVVTAYGLLGVIAAWAVLVPADPYYSPGALGVGSRINAFAGVCIPVFVFGVVRLAATLGLHRAAAWRPWAALTALVLTALIAAGYTRLISTDKAHWTLAGRLQRQELALLQGTVSRPRAGTGLVVFDAPGYTAPGVPIFAAPWDLDGAVKLLYDSRFVYGYPVLTGTRLVCGQRRVRPLGPGYEPGQTTRYGLTYFIDGRRGAVSLVRNRAACLQAVRSLRPGPI